MDSPLDQARIQNAEQDIIRLRKDVREDVITLHRKLDKIMAAISDLRTSRAVDDVTVSSSLKSIKAGLCPDPGSCVRLAPRVTALEQQWSKWHDMQQQAKGAMKTVRAFWLGLGAIITTVMWLVQNYFSEK